MSTVDPAAGRRRLPRLLPRLGTGGRRPVGMGTALGLLAYGAVWTCFGFALADLARFPVADLYLAPGAEPPNNTPGLLWAFFAALLAGSLIGVSLRSGLVDAIGLTLQSALSSTVVNTGIAGGFLLGARVLWEPAPDPGRFTGPAGRPGGGWGPDAWIAWSAAYWVPAVLVLLVVLRVWVSLRYAGAERDRAARTRAVVVTGLRTKGLVTEAREAGPGLGTRPRLHFVVRFVDHDGMARSVTKTAVFRRTGPPRAGDRAVVWYDPSAPADAGRIAVVLTDPGQDDTDLAEALALGQLVIH
ncbi:DUF3592 domain-containing protein [Streptomyces sp. NPDC000594]|uniref:DUF3592 domain-containing protein n=1 Tax=Streptomyces sp. NPDC000594 TaxID=3154261 RepID=UPI00332F1707